MLVLRVMKLKSHYVFILSIFFILFISSDFITLLFVSVFIVIEFFLIKKFNVHFYIILFHRFKLKKYE